MLGIPWQSLPLLIWVTSTNWPNTDRTFKDLRPRNLQPQPCGNALDAYNIYNTAYTSKSKEPFVKLISLFA